MRLHIDTFFILINRYFRQYVQILLLLLLPVIYYGFLGCQILSYWADHCLYVIFYLLILLIECWLMWGHESPTG